MNSSPSSPAHWAAQPVLFAAKVSRRALLALPPPDPHQARCVRRINVWRNHALEPMLPLMAPYCAFGRWQPEFRIGGYDDALGFTGHQPADAELVWLDRSRLALPTVDFLPWLHGRLQALRAASVAPVIVCTWGSDGAETSALDALTDALPGVHFADLAAAAAEEETPLLDARTAALSGTPLSGAAQVLLARRLACHWLPAATLPPIKALALDLDHTLHDGVLGEDGAQGVRLSPAHAALQQHARGLRERGIFLALVSRNERAEVEALFDDRSDFPLRWADFSATEISWGDKAVALSRIAAQLRIAPDAVLFVDDNPGELARVAAALPQVHVLHASADAALTQRAIAHHPGVWRWKAGADDGKRVHDLAANAERQQLAARIDSPAAYLRNLQVRLTLHWNDRSQLPRLAELCRKTNQFNLALRRHSEAELAALMDDASAGVASVRLRDRLADSGIVAVVAARRRGPLLCVEDVCISCRAMGRELEDSAVLLALRGMPAFAGCEQVRFAVRQGERNAPARQWLAALLGSAALPDGDTTVPASRLAAFAPPAAIDILETDDATH